jgi:hypothetical protein
MPNTNPLGFNLIPIGVATGKHINMENLQGVVVITYEDGGAQAITVKESIDGSSEQALTCINEIWASSGVAGAFTRETSDADTTTLADESALTKKDTTAFDQACFYIAKEELSAGFNCVEITIDGAGICVVLGVPVVGRALQNQADIVAA